MLNFNQSNFGQEVLKSEIPVLVDFWAPWCGPCKMVAPIIEEISDEYQGKVLVGKVNVDENDVLAGQYEVMSIPTICLFVKGQLAMKLIGFRPKKEIINEIIKFLP